jgi:hypothetical protein
MPSLTITDDSAYIKVVHGDGVVVYYVKASLVVQKLNEETFMLKNDSFANYYNYSDVVEPVTQDLDELLQKLASWNTALSNAFQTLGVSAIYFIKGGQTAQVPSGGT